MPYPSRTKKTSLRYATLKKPDIPGSLVLDFNVAVESVDLKNSKKVIIVESSPVLL